MARLTSRTDRRTDGQTIDSASDPDQEYIVLYVVGNASFCLLHTSVTYFPTNLVYHFTLRVTGI